MIGSSPLVKTERVRACVCVYLLAADATVSFLVTEVDSLSLFRPAVPPLAMQESEPPAGGSRSVSAVGGGDSGTRRANQRLHCD